jgi:predicted acylesterase/phospholipase RssA
VTNPEKVRRRRIKAGAERYSGRVPIASCFGGGGSYGIGFNLGVVMGLVEAGIDVLCGPMVGTSAGSYAAAALRSDVSFEAVMEAWPKEFKLRVARAADVTRPVFGDHHAADVGAVAVRLAPFRRAVLWGGDETLADIVAASSSPPPFAWPHKVGGRRYIDGGYASMASADLAPLADLLVVVTPIWRGAGRAGRRATKSLDRETRAYTSLGTCRVLHVAPDEPILALKGYKIPNMFDAELAKQVFPLARELGLRAGTEWQHG